MSALDPRKFGEFVTHLAKALPAYAPDFKDEQTLRIWFEAFKNYPLDDLRKAFVYLRDHERHFPSIARVKEVIKPLDGGGKFEELIELIARHGGYNPPAVEDLLARTINRLGGWKRVCSWSEDELAFRRKEFEEIYKELSEQSKVGALDQSKPTSLKGIHETAQAYLSMPIAPTPLLSSPNTSGAQTESQNTEEFWSKLKEKFGVDLDPFITAQLKAKRFFKLRSSPGFFYQFRDGVDPLSENAWPYKFVDEFEHRQAIRDGNEWRNVNHK